MSKINRLEFDVRKLKELNSLTRLKKLSDSIGRERFQQAFLELDLVESACLCLLFYDNWQGMIDVCDVYGVGSDNPELNQQFRARLIKKGMAGTVREWHEAYKAQEKRA